MVKRWLTLGLTALWLSASGAQAQDLHVTFRSNPADAEVRILSAGQQRKLPGRTGKSITLQSDWLRQDRLEVEFRLEGYQTWVSRIPTKELTDGSVWPPTDQPAIRLSSVQSAVVYFFLESSPPGARILLSNSGKKPAFLGLTGTQIEIDRSKVNAGPLNFRLERDGYEPAELVVLSGEVAQGARLPRNGPVRLFQTWAGWFRQWGLALAGAGLGLAGLAGWAVQRRRAARWVAPQADPVGTPSPHAEGLAQLGYQLRAELGRGGMAVVYEATRTTSDTLLALKLLHREVGLDGDAISRMRREIKILRELQHPCIVPLYDFGEVNGQYYLVMEKVSGESLKKHLQRGRVPLAEALAFIEALLDGMCYAHAKGIVHRDLKPDNAMIREDGRLQILDFGISRSVTANTFETMDNSVLGTPAFMAPERFSGVTNQASDQYALGLIFYELLTGQEAVSSDLDIAQTIKKQLFETPPKPSSIDPEISPALDYLIMTMIEKKPESRFASLELAREQLHKAEPQLRKVPVF